MSDISAALGARGRSPQAVLLGVGNQRSVDFDSVAVGKHRRAIRQLAEDPNPGASHVDLRMALGQTRAFKRVAERCAGWQSHRDFRCPIRQRENDGNRDKSVPNHDRCLSTSSARLTKASMKVVAM
jgi:hypothetical protein